MPDLTMPGGGLTGNDAESPLVSVLLPVRNGGKFLPLAVNSILGQDGVDFELIIVDDGSTDETPAYLASIGDPRVRVIRLESSNLVTALNTAIAAARGTLLARMDADDVALAGRLARQVDLLRTHPTVSLTFSSAYIIDNNGHRTGYLAAPTLSAAARTSVLLSERAGAPIIHPSVTMRKDMVERLGGYRHRPLAEDHDLWLRAIDTCEFKGIDTPLLEYRHHAGGVSRQKALDQMVSSIINATCYRLRRDTGRDLYEADPALCDALHGWIVANYGKSLHLITKFRALRSRLRRGNRLRALWDVCLSLPEGLGYIFDRSLRAHALEIQHAALAQAHLMMRQHRADQIPQ